MAKGETIRERIERAPPQYSQRANALIKEWNAGNLIPRDEHEAAIAAAERKGMEEALRVETHRSTSDPIEAIRVRLNRLAAIRADMEANDG